MTYTGLHAQKSHNNTMSVLLLCLFPVLVLVLLWLGCYLLYGFGTGSWHIVNATTNTAALYIEAAPWVLGGVLVWFLIAYFANTAIIQRATNSQPLERKDNKRVYNLVENLCMSQGMSMPKVNVIRDNSLNAFASGINKHTYTVTLTTGIIDRLADEELEAVIAHELSHIRNHDVRLLIVSIVFVGVFAMLAQIALRALWYAPSRRSSKDGKGALLMILIVLLISAIGYFFATLMRFAISRKREYLADAGAAEMTKNPLALATALRKISGDHSVEISRDDVAQLFIEHPAAKEKRSFISTLFATHPPISKRIQILEQF